MKHRICWADLLLLILVLAAVVLLHRPDFSEPPTVDTLVADMERYTELNLGYEETEPEKHYMLVAIAPEDCDEALTISQDAPLFIGDTATRLGTMYATGDQEIILFCPLYYTRFTTTFADGSSAHLGASVQCRTEDGHITFRGNVTWIGYDL